jgi:hypothetical protein
MAFAPAFCGVDPEALITEARVNGLPASMSSMAFA